MKFIIEVVESHIHVYWESRVGVVRVEVPNDNLTTWPFVLLIVEWEQNEIRRLIGLVWVETDQTITRPNSQRDFVQCVERFL